jgi:uncharacterized membrane-anchored protein YhcB (DUF1043 family)
MSNSFTSFLTALLVIVSVIAIGYVLLRIQEAVVEQAS